MDKEQCKANETEIKSAWFGFDCIFCREQQPVNLSELGLSNHIPVCDKCVDDLREAITSRRAKIKQSTSLTPFEDDVLNGTFLRLSKRNSTFKIKLNAEDY